MSALFSLKGQRALVTGASRGLGKAIAQALAQAGASIICCSSSLAGAGKTAAEIEAQGGEAFALAADLSDLDQVRSLAQQALALGDVHILVNCGGTIFRAPAVD